MKMIKWIFGVFFFISISAFGQNKDCAQFKNGKFKIIEENMENSIIVRNGDVQIEYGEYSQLKVELKVTWVDDCNYTLTLVQVIENPKGMNIPTGMVLYVEIIETKEQSYMQKTTSNINDFVSISELIRIE